MTGKNCPPAMKGKGKTMTVPMLGKKSKKSLPFFKHTTKGK